MGRAYNSNDVRIRKTIGLFPRPNFFHFFLYIFVFRFYVVSFPCSFFVSLYLKRDIARSEVCRDVVTLDVWSGTKIYRCWN